MEQSKGIPLRKKKFLLRDSDRSGFTHRNVELFLDNGALVAGDEIDAPPPSNKLYPDEGGVSPGDVRANPTDYGVQTHETVQSLGRNDQIHLNHQVDNAGAYTFNKSQVYVQGSLSEYNSDANTTLLLHLNADYTDSSSRTNTVTNVGASISTSVKKLGAGSGYFDGASYLTVPSDQKLTNGSFEDATISTAWTVAGTGATLERSTEKVKVGTYSAKLNQVSGADGKATQDIQNAGGHNLAYWKGKTVTFGAWVYALSNKANIFVNDGATTSSKSSHSGSGTVAATRSATSPATYVDASGVIQVLTTSNTPRYDAGYYDATGYHASQNLKLEAAATNLLPYTDGLGYGNWLPVDYVTGTLTVAFVDVPTLSSIASTQSGRVTYTGVLGDTGVDTNAIGVLSPLSAVGSVSYGDTLTFSFWARSQTGLNGNADLMCTGSIWSVAVGEEFINDHFFNVTAGYANGHQITTAWRKFSFTKTMNTPTGSGGRTDADISRVRGEVIISFINNTNTVDLEVYGFQIEKASAATSWIPTDTTALIRNDETLGTTGWEYLTVTHTISSSATSVTPTLQIDDGGTTTAYFDGAFVTDDAAANFNFGSGDFTIDTQFYMTDVTSGNYAIGGAWDAYVLERSFQILVRTGINIIQFFYSTYGTDTPELSFSFTAVVNTWYHLEVCRSGNLLYMFINGVSLGVAQAITGSLHKSNGVFSVGCQYSSFSPSSATPIRFFPGYLDELRVSKGIARHTANFKGEPTILESSQQIVSSYNGDMVTIQGVGTGVILSSGSGLRLNSRFLTLNSGTLANFIYSATDGLWCETSRQAPNFALMGE